MPVTEAQRRATSKYIAKNYVEERARQKAYYYANKEVIAQKQKERQQRKKAEVASIKAELKKKEDDQRKMVAEIILRHRQSIHEELLQTYKTQGMPAWIVDAICVDMSQLYGLDDPRMLGKDPRLTPEDFVIVPPSPIPDSV